MVLPGLPPGGGDSAFEDSPEVVEVAKERLVGSVDGEQVAGLEVEHDPAGVVDDDPLVVLWRNPDGSPGWGLFRDVDQEDITGQSGHRGQAAIRRRVPERSHMRSSLSETQPIHQGV